MVFVFDQCLFSGRETNSCLVDMRNVFSSSMRLIAEAWCGLLCVKKYG